VLYYSKFCPPCRAFKPTFVEFKEEMENDLPIDLIDCSEEPNLCQDIASYPTVRTMKGKVKFTGARTKEALKGFALAAKNGSLTAAS
jgi:thiol-disulfide isomerase/thioredoxin